MCGICGAFNLELHPLRSPDLTSLMSSRIEHRGPDSHGRFSRSGLALDIRRLSIIDIETGDQPLSNESGEVTLVVNGEIYNYRELRQELVSRGHNFRTGSDGEVITHLYEEKGEDCLAELNGMFALALWDERLKRLLLARDRAGEKPLFYWCNGKELLFASEVKALLECPQIPKTLDPAAIERFLLYGYIPSPDTAFTAIKKLPAAHRMIVDRGNVRVEPYWQLKKFLFNALAQPPKIFNEDQSRHELHAQIVEAVQSRLVSDVPLGVFLSGGVDSSALVACMSKLTPGNVKSFTIGFSEASFNEAGYANQVAQTFKTQHHVVTADEKSLREALWFLSGFMDEPLGDPAVLPTYLISRFARETVKVALSGEGGDELFGGYPTYTGYRIAEYFLRIPKMLRRDSLARLVAKLPGLAGAVPVSLFISRFFDHLEDSFAHRHHAWLGAFSPAIVKQLFSPEWREQHGSCDLFEPADTLIEDAQLEDSLESLLYSDYHMYLGDDLLTKLDRASMACSIELRTPFLDQRLVEFAAGLPMEFKLRGFKTKYLFKKAMEGHLSSKILYRQKLGFSVPVGNWMRRELKPLVQTVLAREKIVRDGIFEPDVVQRLLEEHWSRRFDHRRGLWALLMFQIWHDHWVRGSRGDFS